MPRPARDRKSTVPFGGRSTSPDDAEIGSQTPAEEPQKQPRKRAATATPAASNKNKKKAKESTVIAVDPALESTYLNPTTALEGPKSPFPPPTPPPTQFLQPPSSHPREGSVRPTIERTPIRSLASKDAIPRRELSQSPAVQGAQKKEKNANYQWNPPTNLAMIDSFIVSKNCGLQNGAS